MSLPAPPDSVEVVSLMGQVPAALAPWCRLAYNYWWSWQPEGASLFRAIDPACWQVCQRNPVRLLREASRANLQRAAADPKLVARANALALALRSELQRPFANVGAATSERPIAFFCAEYAIHDSLAGYAGGLGVLAGDLLKEASDRAVPLVAVGLLYRRGAFHQRIDRSGWQHEHWTEYRPEALPMTPVLAADGTPLTVDVPLGDREVQIQIWRVQVGRISLFLLDTDLPANDPVDRFISAQLYVSDRDLRLLQYVVLGVGGARALHAMGLDPATLHLNEGHASLAVLELLHEQMQKGATFESALEATRARTVFTTHTPVHAGNESYAFEDLRRVWGELPSRLGLDESRLRTLGGGALDGGQRFGLTELALRASRSANGVSRKHGEVARAMWQSLWPDRATDQVPITHVTNGVHLGTWMAAPMRTLLDRHLGADWSTHASDPERWRAVDAIPDEELWAVRKQLRRALVESIRSRTVVERLVRGDTPAYAGAAARAFDADVLTIGFARRIASYKRLHLLVEDPARALGFLGGPRPIQLVLAGKAHPDDEQAKQLVQRIFQQKNQAGAGGRVVFLEDYDLATAAQLVAGCDVWVNLPRPPMEASGTSGMKAALNGGLNLGVLDGWWAEAFDRTNGWGIAADPIADATLQDQRDAGALYSLLSREVIPLFYGAERGAVPHGWIARIKASLRSIAPVFTTGRMLDDYCQRIYRP